MKENSPIWARLAEIINAVAIGCRNSTTIKSAASDLPTTMTNRVATNGHGSRTTLSGSNSMPTETKNSTAKASRSGNVSWAARWLSGDSRSIIPAKKAPSASETPNSLVAPKAMQSAIASTVSRNSSREPVCAI